MMSIFRYAIILVVFGLVAGFAVADETTLSVEETRQAEQGTRGTLVGIGVKLSQHPDGLLIDLALPGQAAEKSGLRAGEIITSVDGRSTKGMSLAEGVKAITGVEGTQVALEIKSPSGEIRDIKITREIVKVTGVAARLLEDKIGYLGMTMFNQETPSAVRDALITTLSPQNARGIIVDLRGNSGGVYPAVLKVAEMLIDGDPPKMLWITRQKGKEPVIVQAKSIALTTLPFVVLIDEKTSGSAELLAAAMSQNAGAKLVGAKTAGGAVLRERIANPDGASRVVEIGDFLFPKTGKTGKDSVIPDVVAPEGATPDQALELARKTLADLIAR